MAEDAIIRFTLAVVVGTLAAIVYCLRVLILMERRVARIEMHIDKLVHQVIGRSTSISRKTAKRRR